MVLYLLPIIVLNGILYFRFNSNMPLTKMANLEDEIPKAQVLVQTQYYEPFTKYNGTILWIERGNDLKKIDSYLISGKRVYLDSYGLNTPYFQFVGNNYHITSLDKVGNSDAKKLFEKYEISDTNGIYEIKKIKTKDGSEVLPVIEYSSGFWGRLARNRIDYGDVGSWISTIITNHKDPLGWTYR